MAEQLLFGLSELETLKKILFHYYNWFGQADYATVVLVTVIGTLVQSLILLVLLGGRARIIALVLFGFIGLSEVHHLIETLLNARYSPGAVTAVPYVAAGFYLLRAALQEYRARPSDGKSGLSAPGRETGDLNASTSF